MSFRYLVPTQGSVKRFIGTFFGNSNGGHWLPSHFLYPSSPIFSRQQSPRSLNHQRQHAFLGRRLSITASWKTAVDLPSQCSGKDPSSRFPLRQTSPQSLDAKKTQSIFKSSSRICISIQRDLDRSLHTWAVHTYLPAFTSPHMDRASTIHKCKGIACSQRDGRESWSYLGKRSPVSKTLARMISFP